MAAGSKYSGAIDVAKDLFMTMAGATHGKVELTCFLFFYHFFLLFFLINLSFL